MAFQTMIARAQRYVVSASTDWNVIVSNFAEIWKGTTEGDMDYYASATGKTRLAVGDEGQVLTVVSGVPAWAVGVPAGAILDFGGTSIPTGFLGCDGSAVSRVTYAALFSAIGTTWGAGDGSTTFNVPDFRRRTAVGSGGTGTTTLDDLVGSTGGAETVILSLTQIPGHNHGYTATIVSPGANDNTTETGLFYNTNANSAGTTSTSGGGGAHNNLQPSAVVLKIIKI